VAVDPPVSSGPRSDACGIVGAGLTEDGRAYVLADATEERAPPLVWAAAVVKLYDQLAADCVVTEINQGGDLVTEILRQVSPNLPVRTVRAMRGKFLRAEPIAALYEQGRVAHVGIFSELEDQMCDFGPQGLSNGRSPDRVDALVWALTELMLSVRGSPRIRTLAG
jgi:phage terminase large subunit-like protein